MTQTHTPGRVRVQPTLDAIRAIGRRPEDPTARQKALDGVSALAIERDALAAALAGLANERDSGPCWCVIYKLDLETMRPAHGTACLAARAALTAAGVKQ